MGTFIDSTYMKLVPSEVISSGCNALVVPFQQLLEGPIQALLCERINNLRHSLFHLLNFLITTASELGNKQKSLEARSGRQGGWGTVLMPILVK